MNNLNWDRGITLVGLGPGETGLVTRAVWEWLENIPEIYLRTVHHPVVVDLPPSLKIIGFDDIYDHGKTFEDVYETIIGRILELGGKPGGVTYAVPGHPLVAEITSPEIIKRAKMQGIPVRILDGLSFLEPVFTVLNIDPFDNLVLLDALEIARHHHPKFPPSFPALISQIYSRQVASDVKLTLMAAYPDQHRVQLVHNAGTSRTLVEEMALYEIDRTDHVGLMSVLYLPPLGENTAFESFQEIIAHLRAPQGCPWDREQTHQSLRNNLLEETYEALIALDRDDTAAIEEELGDILLQIVLHAQIASEYGEFTMADIINGISAKIIRRHPHVFSNEKTSGVETVLQKWEDLKRLERDEKNNGEFRGMLESVPAVLPALAQAQEIQARAARVGFDWERIEDAWSKVYEELDEVKRSANSKELEDEFGDLLFAIVNVIRWQKLDAESVLRLANSRFRSRFQYIESSVNRRGKVMRELSLKEMDLLWEEAKRLERKPADL